ncbi:hypothetical protein SUGI_0463500 [Cryptomeria japonica]|nr:hypothetical protein SUGI_0463500 [Cryptomeria japonica]
MGLLTTLAERWHSETCTFHLPMGEMIVTLEDVYRILRIPIDGELIPYDRDGDREALRRVNWDLGLEMRARHVAWDTIRTTRLALPVVLGGVISGFLCPDRATRGLAVGWGSTLETLVTRHTRYAWGPCMLAHSYYELHQFIYHGSVGLGCGVTLLQRRVLDEVDIVIWRPYRECEQWEDDAVDLPYTFRSRYPIGRMPYVLER